MHTTRKPARNELMRDYYMLGKMSGILALHRKSVMVIGRRVARTSKTPLTSGIVHSLELVEAHMKKAQAELGRAQERLKDI
jgi:uroporphyrinogen-III synthase